LAWDEESIDDPTAQPQGQVSAGPGAEVVDVVAVRGAVDGAGVAPPLTVLERREVVRVLAAARLWDARIATRLGVSGRAVLRIRRRDDIPAGPTRAAPPASDAEWAEPRGATGVRGRPGGREGHVALARPAVLVPAR
jgi:hypothetical protein